MAIDPKQASGEFFGQSTTASAARPRTVSTQNPVREVDTSSAIGGGSAGAARLDFTSNYRENPLSSFDQVAYNFRLFTTSAPEGGGNQIIIAETGVTGFNIRDVEMRHMVGPNFNTRATNSLGFTITITEPVGTSFLDALYLAATKNRIENYLKYIYYLELSFKGYQPDGTEVTNLLGSTSGGGKWVWPIDIIDIDVQLDASGGTYVIKAVPYYESVFNPNEELRIKDVVAVFAETVGEFFTSLGKTLTETVRRNYGTDLYTIAFQTHAGRDGKNPGDFKLTPKDKDRSNEKIRLFSEEGSNKVTGLISPGTAIPDIVDMVMASCEEAQSLARNGLGAQDTSSLKPGETRERVVCRIYPEVRISGFDPNTRQYKKTVTFHIHPFVTQTVVLDSGELTTSSAAQLNALKARNALVKSYDYLYTGLNTEVLQFDLRYNFAWSAQLPSLEGYRYSYDATSYHARYNPITHADPNTYDTRLQQTASAVAGLSSPISAVASSASGVIQSVSGILPGTAGVLNGVTSGLSAVGGLVSQVTDRLDDLVGQGSDLRQMLLGGAERLTRAGEIEIVASANGKTYAEDLRSGTGSTVPVSFTQTREDARANAGTGFTSDWDRGKSIYGIVLDQLYGPMASNQMVINLEIKGDPYWLGPSGMEYLNSLTSTPQSSTERPDWRGGEHCFLLNIRYPHKISDEGAPDIRRQDVFSGVYVVKTVTSKFSGGEFRQNLDAYRMQLIETNGSSNTAPSSGSTTTTPTTSGVFTPRPASPI